MKLHAYECYDETHMNRGKMRRYLSIICDGNTELRLLLVEVTTFLILRLLQEANISRRYFESVKAFLTKSPSAG